MSAMRVLVIAAITLVILYLVLLGALYFWQSRLIFSPVRQLHSNPMSEQMAYEDVTFLSGKETVHGWYVEGRPGQPVVLYCHGNAGNISDRITQIQAMHEAGLSVLAFDYAGYGWSTGKPSEVQMNLDAAAAFSWLVKRGFPADRQIMFGESLGGAVAAQLAANTHPLLLVLEAAFTSLHDVAQYHYSWVPVGWLLKFRFDTRDDLSRVKCRTVIAHSPQDEVVPIEHARLLCAGRESHCEFIQTTGTHNTMPPLPWSRLVTESTGR